MTFHVGQRWASQAESELGLGAVIEVDRRRVTLLFPAADATRQYQTDTAPLVRVRFSIGETIHSHEGWGMVVDQVDEQNGCCVYHGERHDTGDRVQLSELQIDANFRLNTPSQRLFAAQYDDAKWFDLRQQAMSHRATFVQADTLGLQGARVDLIPHQLHIANTVADRHAPRVLLSDEVGLGKTIEAALIIHRQLITARAQRVLIVVPDALMHQWLVEMLRRINLQVALFDESRVDALVDDPDNPFDSEQCVLCALSLLTEHPKIARLATESQWDLMVVDEAHHLQWSPDCPSVAYQVIEQLAQRISGVLLLTATPDQLGHESHFARLRLLDPDRYYDYAAFLAEERQFQTLAQALGPLTNGTNLSDEQRQQLIDCAPDLTDRIQGLDQTHRDDVHELIQDLIDRHGTGRVLFRNTRHSITGFPERRCHATALPLPDAYEGLLAATTPTEQQVYPETHPSVRESWTQLDPRVSWLIELLHAHKGKKVLTLCANNATAIELSEALRVQAGIHAAVFHEGQSIVERDRIANYFADPDHGSPIMICSEVGSEGRNFQFAQHLVLFDLPLVPDLLEQRIGRLDRIGQQSVIHIHVPYIENTAQERLYQWYHQGLNAIEQTCATGTAVFESVADTLLTTLHSQSSRDDFNTVLTLTQSTQLQLLKELEHGRDRLLELGSSGKGEVEPLLDQIQALDDSPVLERFMTHLLDAIGVSQQELSEEQYLLRATEAMTTPLPGLSEEGTTITYDRATALVREDCQFLSWDHPLVHHAMDWLLENEFGNSVIALSHRNDLPNGSYYLNAVYQITTSAPKKLNCSAYLPSTPIEVILDAEQQLVELQFASLSKVTEGVARSLIDALKPRLETMLHQTEHVAVEQAEQLKKTALDKVDAQLSREIARLQELQKVNPNVRDDEIEALQQEQRQLRAAISAAQTDIQAVQLIVNTH